MEKVQKQATTFFKEFQAFISKGNVVDLAVAVIVGAAFNNIISSLVKDIINPILGALIGKPDFTNLFWVMKMLLKAAPTITERLSQRHFPSK